MEMKLITAPSKSQQVADILYKKIETGELTSGSRLQSVRTLAEMFHVSSKVVFTAIEILEKRSAVIRHPRQGVFVKEQKQTSQTSLFGLITQYHPQDIEGYFEAQQQVMTDSNSTCITIPYKEEGTSEKVIQWLQEQNGKAIFVDLGPWPSLTNLEKLAGEIPLCFVHRWQWPTKPVHPAVVIDLRHIYRTAFEYFFGKGHKRIAVVSPFGCLHDEHGIDLIPAAESVGCSFPSQKIELVSIHDFTNPSRLETLFSGNNPVTALVGISDYIVFSFYSKLKQHIPELHDIELIGNYNTAWSQQAGHEFSSFRIDYQYLWQQAVDCMMNGNLRIEWVKPEFIERCR